MKKIILIIIVQFISFLSFAQTEIPAENISLEVVNARKIGAFTIQFINPVGNLLPGKENKRIQVRVKIKSLNGDDQLFDPNKLYLVNDQAKLRFAIAEVYFATFFRGINFSMLTDKKPDERQAGQFLYKPEIPNTFNNFPYKDYNDVPLAINFGTRKRPNTHHIYFQPVIVKKNKLDIFFVVPDGLTNGQIYYGNTLIEEISYKE